MKKISVLCVLIIVLFPQFTVANPVAMQSVSVSAHAISPMQAARERAREKRNDARSQRSDRREDRRDRNQDRREDRQDNRQDRRDDVKDRREDRRDDRQDRREDRRDDVQDRREDRRDDRQDRREDRRDDRRDERWERYWRYRVGLRLVTLPLRHTRIVVGTTVYYHSDGVYLVEQNGAYVVVSAPVGASIVRLPYGFRSFYVGPRRYFRVNSVYYVYRPEQRVYVVVDAPETDAPDGDSLTDPIVYPSEGQSQEQIDQDRFECHGWAMEESGFDPLTSVSELDSEAERYHRALVACLSGRGYSVN